MSITFFKLKPSKVEPKKGYWDNQDIADFYRAVDLLKQAGLNTEVDSGVTDEGDPWFVFIKTDTAEVIAPFAQIDGLFVAVSSLNHEVYKGSDIRSIVNQMLERHPILLPQSKNSGRLMLHPTAALSAFLAAAFVLTLDGVKASSLTDVLVGVASEGGGLNIDNEAPPTPYGQRYETLKGMFSELNLASYNVAVLGAALILRELSHNELDLNPQSVEEYVSMALSSEEKGKGEGEDLNFNINLEHNRSSSESSHLAYSIKSKNSNLNNKEGDNGHSEDKFDGGENNYGIITKSVLQESASENIASVSEEYEVLWTNGDKVLKNNYQPIHQITINNAGEQFDTTRKPEFDLGDSSFGSNLVIEQFDATRELEFVVEDDPFDSNLAVVMENLQESFQLIPSSLRSEAFLGSDGLGMTFNSAGELRLISLDSVGQKSLKGEADRDHFFPTEQVKPMISAAGLPENTDVSNASLENEANGASQVEPIVYSKPIVGHSLNKINHTLLLTDAIDVVFYKGGDAEISKFELGTDLLWFFLSEEELKTVNNSVNHNGDLVLDFGDTGTLTFLGMVSDTFVDDIAYV